MSISGKPTYVLLFQENIQGYVISDLIHLNKQSFPSLSLGQYKHDFKFFYLQNITFLNHNVHSSVHHAGFITICVNKINCELL